MLVRRLCRVKRGLENPLCPLFYIYFFTICLLVSPLCPYRIYIPFPTLVLRIRHFSFPFYCFNFLFVLLACVFPLCWILPSLLFLSPLRLLSFFYCFPYFPPSLTSLLASLLSLLLSIPQFPPFLTSLLPLLPSLLPSFPYFSPLLNSLLSLLPSFPVEYSPRHVGCLS